MKTKRDGGLVEMFCMGLLLLLFGIGAYTLVMMGSDSFARMLVRRDAGANVRIALSFAANQIRNADAEDGISIRATEAGDALVLTQVIDGERYDTYIYWHNNALKEYSQTAELPFMPEAGEWLTGLGGFALSCPDGRGIRVTAWDGEGANRRESSIVLTPRSQSAGEAGL